MRPLVAFDATAPEWRVRDGRAARLRADAALAFLALVPGISFVRQRTAFLDARRAEDTAASATGPYGTWRLRDGLEPAKGTSLPVHGVLSGSCFVELDRQGPVLLPAPRGHDGRYFSVTVLDAHLNVIASLGPTWTGRGAQDVLVVPPGWIGDRPDYTRIVRAPTASVCLLLRAAVRDDGDDRDRVHSWCDRLAFAPEGAWSRSASCDDLRHPEIPLVDDPWEFFRIGFEHLVRNPLPAHLSWVADAIDVAGLMSAADGDDLARIAVIDGIEDAEAQIDATLTDWPTGNGWRLPYAGPGRPSAHIVENAALQLYRLGAQDPAEVLSFIATVDSEGRPLDGEGGTYELAFHPDATPPVLGEGFWTLTTYDEGDRLAGQMHLPSTAAPSGHSPHRLEDPTLGIVLAASRPDGVEETVWTPTPPARFRACLRLYHPLHQAVGGGWYPPALRRLDPDAESHVSDANRSRNP